MTYERNPNLGDMPAETASAKAGNSETKQELNKLRTGQELEKAKTKITVTSLLKKLIQDFSKLDAKERMKRIGEIITIAIIGKLSGKKEEAPEDKKDKKKKKKPKKRKDTNQRREVADQEEESEEPTGIEKERQVVCSDRRLICINTHPSIGKGPTVLKNHSSWLLEYGLPDYDTFKKEMIEILAPDASSEEEGIKKAVSILKTSPMGKYQCMPLYLFSYVNLPTEGEEGLEAMWLFLQSEELQRNACKGYMQGNARSSTENPRYLAAAYYGGADEIAKMKRYDSLKDKEAKEGKESLTEEELQHIARMEGRQKGYPAIVTYANSVARYYAKMKKGTGFDMEAMLDATAQQESGALEGETAKPRDEKWEKDERYARNQTEKNNETV